jgi:hypothetical protein
MHADVYLEANPKYTEFECFEDKDEPDVYYKTHRVVQFRWPVNLAWNRTRGILDCEKLRMNLHPNICEYLGVWSNVKLRYEWQGN